MIARATMLPGGNATNIDWIVGNVEDTPLYKPFSLALAAESFHWFDWSRLCPALALRLDHAPLVLVEDRREVGSPWSTELQRLIPEFSTNRDFQPYDLLRELTERGVYFVQGRRALGPDIFRQSIEDYITSIHSRNGFSRDRMTPEAAVEFDTNVRYLVAPYAKNGIIELHIETHVVWGRATTTA